MRKKIVGTDGDDVLVGTSNDDWLIGGDGADVVHGRQGDDYLGDLNKTPRPAFDDIYRGGKGDDRFRTESGNDLLFGGRGNDIFTSWNEDSFTIDGGTGRDVVNLMIDLPLDAVVTGNEELTTVTYGDVVITLRDVEDFRIHQWDF